MRLNPLLVLGACALLVGCYSLQPTRGAAPEPGDQVAFDVTDVGRVALGGSMGPEISQVEGRLVEAQNGDYVVAVSAVRLLRGGQQIWRGEQVRINKQHVGRLYERRFSKGRTVALGVAVVAGAVFVLGRDLNPLGSPDTKQPPTDSIVTLRIPLSPVRP